jgi:hypothetical protein
MRGADVNWLYLKTCARCREANRAFANFCRACGEALDAADSNWLGYKGGVRRLGSAAAPCREPAGKVEIVDAGLDLRLGDVCRSLLGYDGHLIAVSRSGTIEIADPHQPAAVQRFQAHGPVSAEPCIDHGVLYIGTPGQIVAYSLGAMTLCAPRSRPLWRVPLGGSPVQALTPLGGRLYMTVATEGRKEVVAIDNVRGDQPSPPRTVCAAKRLSWIAADPVRGEAVFLSDDDNGVQIHVAASSRGDLVSHPVPLGRFSEEHPIAFLGGSVFALFDDARLYRIDASTGGIDETFGEDAKLFSLTRDDDDEWDRDSVQIDSSGIVFSRTAIRDTFSHLDRAVKGSPVIVHGRMAAVGMEDGRVLLYDLTRLPGHDVWRLGGAAGSPVTALASFDSFIAAGNRDGVVGVRELRTSPGAGTS